LKNRFTIILVHGFAGSIEEVEPLKIILEKKGYAVTCPELAGHSTKEALRTVTYRDWIASVKEVCERHSKQNGNIVLIGFSMGGLINAHIAAKKNVAAFITINTPIYYWDIKRIVKNLFHDIKTGERANIKYYWDSSTKTPLKGLLNFTKILRLSKLLFKEITCPALVAHGKLDDTAHIKSADFIYHKLASKNKKLIFYPNAGHKICHSVDNNQLAEDIDLFLSESI
jgi:carboxylesterase